MDFAHLEENCPLEGRRQERKAEGKREPQESLPHHLHGWGAHTGGPGTGVAVVWDQQVGRGALGAGGRCLPGDATQRDGNSRTRTHSCLVSLGACGYLHRSQVFTRRGWMRGPTLQVSTPPVPRALASPPHSQAPTTTGPPTSGPGREAAHPVARRPWDMVRRR